MSTPPVQIIGSELSVRFDRFGDPAQYALFLKCKRLPESVVTLDADGLAAGIRAPARYAPMLGVPMPSPERPDLAFPSFLFDDQREIVAMALEAKRFADWKDTGLGKTLDFLEWSRQVAHRTGQRVLVVTLNNLIAQTCDEAAKFYGDGLPVVRLGTRAAMREWCGAGTVAGSESPARVGIVNYEKFNPDGAGSAGQVVPEVRQLGGVALDESSRLAMGGGKQKWAIIKSSKGVPYKLSCTATPAPNATMEFASQASFLERMRSEGEIIWTYFRRDPKTHRWGVRPHARAAFFEWMSSWSIYVRDPRRYGWRASMPDLPEPDLRRIDIAPTPEQLAAAGELLKDRDTGQFTLFADRSTNTVERGKLAQVAHGFRYRGKGGRRRVERIPSRKPGVVVDLAAADAAEGRQVLVWTVFDAESEGLAAELRRRGVEGFELLTGKTPETRRDDVLERFRKGQVRGLISRASMLGYGMNFQFCTSMVFSGWSDSYVQFYQAVRRAVRYGQTERVRVWVPVVADLEQEMLDNIFAKDDQRERDVAEMEANYIRSRAAAEAARAAALAGGAA